MRTVQIEALRDGGWETVDFENIEEIRLGGAPGEDGIQFTLIGQRADTPNQVETGILDIADRHEMLIDSQVPKRDGRSLPLAVRDDEPDTANK